MMAKLPTSAINYYRAANGHLVAAKILAAHVGPKSSSGTSSLFLAFSNVLGFAVELYLKAFLASYGLDSDQLSSHEFGHNLERLLKASIDRGLVDQTGQLGTLIGHLHINHQSYTFRYPSDKLDLQFIDDDSLPIAFHALTLIDQDLARNIPA